MPDKSAKPNVAASESASYRSDRLRRPQIDHVAARLTAVPDPQAVLSFGRGEGREQGKVKLHHAVAPAHTV